MGTRYICDVCKKECDVKEGYHAMSYPMTGEFPLDKWATISYLAPRLIHRRKQAEQQVPFYPMGGTPEAFLVCSQACAVKALDEIKEHLWSDFESL